MGAGPSRTRKLTLENEESSDLISVSQDVVDRLKGLQANPPKQDKNVSPGGQWPGFPGGVPPQYYFPHPNVTSLQCRQEKEVALKKNDQYWEKRVQELEKAHGKMHHVMETEYQKALDEVKTKKSGEELGACYMPPCQSRKKAVMECYKKYPDQPMRCSKEVQAFAECVDVQRASLVANRG